MHQSNHDHAAPIYFSARAIAPSGDDGHWKTHGSVKYHVPKMRCCPKEPARKIPAQHLRGRPRCRACTRENRGVRSVTPRPQARRDAVRPLEAHPEARPSAIAWAPGGTGRVHAGRDRPEPAQARQAHGTPAANCRYVCSVSVRWGRTCIARIVPAPNPKTKRQNRGSRSSLKSATPDLAPLVSDFRNKIGTSATCRGTEAKSACKPEADISSPAHARPRS